MSRELSWWKSVKCRVYCFILMAYIAHLFPLDIWTPNASSKKLQILVCCSLPSLFFFLWKEMDHFFASLTGPSADIARGCVLVLINCIFSCNNFACEPHWIGFSLFSIGCCQPLIWKAKPWYFPKSGSWKFCLFLYLFLNQNDHHVFAWEIATCKNAF